jgi:hypothetical protein
MSGDPISMDTEFDMNDFLIFPGNGRINTNVDNIPTANAFAPTSNIINPHDDFLGTAANRVTCFDSYSLSPNHVRALSPCESGYSSASDGSYQFGAFDESHSSNDSKFFKSPSVSPRSTRPKTVSFYETRTPILTDIQLSKRGRPRQNLETYDAEIFKAIADEDYQSLKIARNKKSSQVYRLRKRHQTISAEKELLLQSKINRRLTKKLARRLAKNQRLQEVLFN